MRNLPTTAAAAANNKNKTKTTLITAQHKTQKQKISCDGLYNSMFCCVSGYIDYMNLLSTLFSFLIIIFLFYLLCFVFVVRLVCRRDVSHHTVLLLLLLVVESAVESLSNFPVALSRRVAVSHPSPKYL